MKDHDFSPEELDFIIFLQPAGLPDDLTEVALGCGPRPTPQALARMKERTLKKASTGKPYAGVSPGSILLSFTRIRWTWAVAAVLALSIIIAAVLGPQQVVAGIRGMLKYINGIGLRDAGQITLAMEKQIKVRHGGMVLEVRGLVSDGNGTVVHLQAVDSTQGKKAFIGSTNEGDMLPYLVDESGRRYLYTSYSVSTGGDITAAWIGFEPLPPSSRHATLILPDHTESADTWQVEIPLTAGEALAAAEEFGPTVYLRGVAVTARVEMRPDETIVPLLVRPDQTGAVVEEVGRHTADGATQSPKLRDEAGKEYHFLRKSSLVGGTPNELRELRFDPVDSEAGPVSLSIPLMRIREQGTAKVSLPVPGNNPVELDRVVQLGRFSLKLVRAELVDGEVRIYVDLGPNSNEALESFSLELKKSGGWMNQRDEQTDRMVYFQVPVFPGQKKLTLTLKDPVVAVTGPWELVLPVH